MSHSQNITRVPLIRVFGISLSIILSLFLLLSWLTFSRLLNFESIIRNVSDRALPEIALSGQLYGEASRLMEFTDLLTRSNSDAARRLAEQKLAAHMKSLKALSSSQLQNEFLDTQLEIINIELLELANLIKQRAKMSKQLRMRKDEVYTIFAEAFTLSSIHRGSRQESWEANVSRIMLATNQALNVDKLREVREFFDILRQQTTHLEHLSQLEENAVKKKRITEKLALTMFGNRGLEESVISELKLNGRVIGRENFMHHLIEDYARLLEFSADEIKTAIFSQVTDSVSEVKKQTNMIGVVIAVAIVFLFFIVFFIQQKVLKRLRIFNRMVQSKTHGIEYKTLLRGNDEITDLAATFNEYAKTIEIQKERLEHMSLSDGLTGIANRRALDIRLLHDIELSIRQQSSVAILLMDIDCFKLFNDNYGHSAGDECLKSVAEVINLSLQRDSDFVARYGGEEFVCIMPNTDLKGAQDIAGQIIHALEQLNICHQYSDVSDHVTMSIGIAVSNKTQVLMPEAIIKNADKALYAAKKSGKNRFETYSPELNIHPKQT